MKSHDIDHRYGAQNISIIPSRKLLQFIKTYPTEISLMVMKVFVVIS